MRIRDGLLVICAVAMSQAALAAANDPPVKKSDSGICHERGSGAYKQTRHFEPYDSMDACLQSGGRESKVAAASNERAENAQGSAQSWKNIAAIGVVVLTIGVVGWFWYSGRRRSNNPAGPQ